MAKHRMQFTALDNVRCEHTISWGKGETAQCRRAKAGAHYCRQHEQMAGARVEADRNASSQREG